VKRLRDKIDRGASRHTFIQTRFGVGYKLDPMVKDSAAESIELESENAGSPES